VAFGQPAEERAGAFDARRLALVSAGRRSLDRLPQRCTPVGRHADGGRSSCRQGVLLATCAAAMKSPTKASTARTLSPRPEGGTSCCGLAGIRMEDPRPCSPSRPITRAVPDAADSPIRGCRSRMRSSAPVSGADHLQGPPDRPSAAPSERGSLPPQPRRRTPAPTTAKPPTSISQVAGSGTWATENAVKPPCVVSACVQVAMSH